MKLHITALLAATALTAIALAACSSSAPTATRPAGTSTPVTGVGPFMPDVYRSEATEADDVGGSWGGITRWDAGLGWSIELPEDGEWEFIRTITSRGNERIVANRTEDDEEPQFRVVRLALGTGTEELLPPDYDCGAALRTVLETGDVAESDRLPQVLIGGHTAKLSRLTAVDPPAEGHSFAVCIQTDDYLYMASGHAPEEDDEDDVLAMIQSLRLDG